MDTSSPDTAKLGSVIMLPRGLLIFLIIQGISHTKHSSSMVPPKPFRSLGSELTQKGESYLMNNRHHSSQILLRAFHTREGVMKSWGREVQ